VQVWRQWKSIACDSAMIGQYACRSVLRHYRFANGTCSGRTPQQSKISIDEGTFTG
jgi:hypothetical protein